MSVLTVFRTFTSPTILSIKNILGEITGKSVEVVQSGLESARFLVEYQNINLTIWMNYNNVGTKYDISHTYFSATCCDESKNLFKMIAEYFGGWVDENDCDDEDDIYFEREHEKSEQSIDEQIYAHVAKFHKINHSETENIVRYVLENKLFLEGIFEKMEDIKKTIQSEYTKEQKSFINSVKSGFQNYFDGVLDYEPVIPNLPLSRLCIESLNFEFKENICEITITLQRPGLLIGKGGSTIDGLVKYLSDKDYTVKFQIVTSKLWNHID